jgi:broad specificity phosphatase PhoE
MIHFITHPEVAIDPAMPVTKWRLSPTGERRMWLAAERPWLANIEAMFCSQEIKATHAAFIISKCLHIGFIVIDELGENDRSATGYLPKDEYEAVADQFFAQPETSIRGWERAIDAQRRIVQAVKHALSLAPEGNVVIVSHGAVGALLRCHLKGAPISRSEDQPGNGGGNMFSFDRDWHVLSGWQRIEHA